MTTKKPTQTEEIVWRKFPESEPGYHFGKLITVMFDGDINNTAVGIWFTDWSTQFSGRYIVSAEIIAWSELPKGWQDD